ncbi:hypothetical protein LUZ60_008022 [Juncus effusus]|nr:hypothetical protein LUZ60_008022 [Juncus effusus]
MSTEEMDDSAESGWIESGRCLLSRGWSIGKNVALAGAAIGVAPVLVPPLLVFSVFGLALSVPFGVYYAGMVGTERLMGSLLPLGEGQDEEVRNEDEETVGVVRDGSEISEKKGERNDQGDVIIEFNKPEPQEAREDNEKSVSLEEEGKDISSVPIEGELWQKTVVETVYDVKDGNNEGDEITTKMVEIKPIKVRSEDNQKITEKTENVEAQNLGLEGKKRKTPDEAKGENGSSGLSSEFTSAGDAQSTMTTDREEKQYNKKQLWEQVRSLRIVIGYKDPICKNLPDEMRALYHFTGVELPLTAADVTSIMDLNYKLHFLKSVIGVK